MEKRIIGVVSGKGGVGKTTVSVNLGILAAQSGSNVLVVDADIGNPTVGLHLGQWQYAHGMQDVAKKKIKLEEAVVVHPPSGLHFLPSTFSDVSDVHVRNLKPILRQSDFDTIIIDTPPGFSHYIYEVMGVCSEIVLVANPSMPSVTSATRMTELSKKAKVKTTGIVLNRVTNSAHEMHPKEVEKVCETRIISIIPEDRAVAESISAKIPVSIYAPYSPVGRSFSDLATYLFNIRAPRPLWQGFGPLNRLIYLVRSIFRF